MFPHFARKFFENKNNASKSGFAMHGRALEAPLSLLHRNETAHSELFRPYLFCIFGHRCFDTRPPPVPLFKFIGNLCGLADSDTPSFISVMEVTMLLSIFTGTGCHQRASVAVIESFEQRFIFWRWRLYPFFRETQFGISR